MEELEMPGKQLNRSRYLKIPGVEKEPLESNEGPDQGRRSATGVSGPLDPGTRNGAEDAGPV